MSQPTTQSMPSGSVAVVLGTRPEIIKLAHIVRMLGPAAIVIHTGQHYDQGLSDSFFEVFGLPEPAAYLGVGGETRGKQIWRQMPGRSRSCMWKQDFAATIEGCPRSTIAC
jgi:UDP-N-acetylglucosamine 2-epimerase (non-hydrolysing)